MNIGTEHASVAWRFGPVIDALSAHIALVDADSNILCVNRQWSRFAEENGGHSEATGVGTNYLTLMESIRHFPARDSKTAEDVSIAGRIAEGLRRVLLGELPKFQIEYPCDSPTQRRWFLLTVTPFLWDGPFMAAVAHEDITALKAAEQDSKSKSLRLIESFNSIVNAIALFIEKRDPYTAGHQHQVAVLSEAIARVMGLDEEHRYGLRLAAEIHDIGKIVVPAEILARPGGLHHAEHQIIRLHPETGYDILRGIDFPWPIAETVYQHHERMDGSGYPRKLLGDEICLESRIIAVADVFDAMTTHRPYRPARDKNDGVVELLNGRGRHYDPQVVDALMSYLDEAECME